MPRLILKLFLFLVPLGLLWAFPAWVLFTSGDLVSDERFLELQRDSRPMLAEFGYSDNFGYLKLRTVQDEKPEIVALGTSRVMQFRRDLFTRSFYNAGCGSYRWFGNLRRFLDLIERGAEPKLIILGLDQKFFNANWGRPPDDVFKPANPRTNWFGILLSAWDKVYRDYFQGKFRAADLTRPPADDVRRVGLGAIMHGGGYRNDGSHTWSWSGRDEKDLGQIARNEYVYVRGPMAEDTFAQLDAFLSECKRRGIHVAGFLPPFSPRVYQALQREEDDYIFVFKTAERLRPLFERYGFSFGDFTDPVRSHIEDDGFVDGEHASEKAYRRLWTSWAAEDPTLRSFSAH